MYIKRDYIWNPSTCNCKNGKYLASIINDSVITCNKITEPKKTIPTKSTLTKIIPVKTT